MKIWICLWWHGDWSLCFRALLSTSGTNGQRSFCSMLLSCKATLAPNSKISGASTFSIVVVTFFKWCFRASVTRGVFFVCFCGTGPTEILPGGGIVPGRISSSGWSTSSCATRPEWNDRRLQIVAPHMGQSPHETVQCSCMFPTTSPAIPGFSFHGTNLKGHPWNLRTGLIDEFYSI